MNDSPCATEAGLIAPDAIHKYETPGVQAEGSRGQGKTDNSDCAAHTPTDQASKATLRAHLALAGYERRCIDGGATYIVARWGYCRELADLNAVARWVETAIGWRFVR